MSTRSKPEYGCDKSEVENLYKIGIESQRKPKPNKPTLYTSSPTEASKSTSRCISFCLDITEIPVNQSKNLTKTLGPVSNDSSDDTGKFKTKTRIDTKKYNINKTMAHNNLFATLKYIVEAIPFFRWSKHPIDLFYRGM